MFKMGVIGWGGMGHWHTKLVREHISRLSVKGAYDINPEKKESMLRHDLVPYETADALLADPEIDLVLLSVPNNFHKDYAIRSQRRF